MIISIVFFFFFQAEDGIRDKLVTGVQTCALPIFARENGFVSNENAEWTARDASYFELRAVLKISDKTGDIAGESQPFPPRHIFAERHQMYFVVKKIQRTHGIQQRRAVGRSNPAA